MTAMDTNNPTYGNAVENNMPYSGAKRPDHAERLRALKMALATAVFEPPDPSATAIFGVAGSLNHQLAIAQKIGIAGDAFEAAIRAPFALGYILGAAAWHADRYGVTRGPDADKVIVGAHREALGPLTDLEIAAISAEAARSPEFNEGMAAAAADFDAIAADPAVGAFGLVS
jgi:hypothetical protein